MPLFCSLPPASLQPILLVVCCSTPIPIKLLPFSTTMSTASPVVIAARHAAHFKWTTTCASARAPRLPENQKRKIKNKPKNCNLFEIYDEKMNTVAFLNILIIRPESLRRESRRAFFRHRRLPLEPVARQSRSDRRPQTEFKPRFFANFDCILFFAFLYIFYFWGICRVINKFATLPQDICIRNYGNEML